VKFFPPQPRDRLSDLLGASDLGLITMKLGVGNDLVPSKLYGIMAAGRPVLAAVEEGSEVAKVVASQRCGWLAEPESPVHLAQQIRKAYLLPSSERKAAGENGRAACENLYSRSRLTARYEQILRSVSMADGRNP
jgi:colanic acid biosynthesis glycosyl transferase WcaI